MSTAIVQAPVALLLDPDLTASDRLLWLAIQAQSGPVTPTGLAASSRLTFPTIRRSLARLEAVGWYSPSVGAIERSPSAARVAMPAGLLSEPGSPSAARVAMPAGLLSEPGVRPQAKLLYGILQTGPALHSYAAISAHAGVSVVTVRQLVRELAEAGWVQVRQAHQLAPIGITVRIPALDRSAAEVAQAMQRLNEADYHGEAIMREYLSLLIDSDEFEDNARPGFLINPLTDERLELDRYYAPLVAFEHNGSQHYQVSERFPSEQALSMLQARDLMKEALCARRGVRIVVINQGDLMLETMQQKVGALLPLRDLRGHEGLIGFLEKVSKQYRS